jgi:uncharacterized protein
MEGQTMNDSERIVYFNGKDVQMKPSPIDPNWVRDGAPIARNFQLSCAKEGGSPTLLWDCTAGVFDWHYDTDESIYVLEGSAVVRDDDGVEHEIGAGDHVLFRAGAHAVWRVESYVRKVAFFRTPVPRAINLPVLAWRKLVGIASRGLRNRRRRGERQVFPADGYSILK